ncbi:MAG: PilZ domain-containing protein [Candidatus Gastranaerophilales bacterium]|nr:PilZ domain-containing protein [Candidatus Gastranaerophilales bacterium]
MTELLEKNQIISIVPQNFKNSNKGKIVDIQNNFFSLETFHLPEEIFPKKIMEFYSQTKNGMLYFSSAVIDVSGNIITVAIPRKHRFLQRRAFSRIKFSLDMTLGSNGKNYDITSVDLSVGGMKIRTNDSLNIDTEYDLSFKLIGHCINCKYEIIKIEKDETGFYTVSGRFKNLSNIDKITLIRFCMNKNIEDLRRNG